MCVCVCMRVCMCVYVCMYVWMCVYVRSISGHTHLNEYDILNIDDLTHIIHTV